MKKQFRTFCQLTKVDSAKREVWGVLAEEVRDKSGEVFDYTSSKKYFQQWSDSFQKATDGKSYGNLRLMHQAVAVGKLINIEFLDDVKKIYIGAKVVDDEAWNMVEEGVLTGFSIGGIFIDTWMVGKTMHYTAEPVEASIVDNPCMYGATFDQVKAAGVEKRAFKFKMNSLVKDVVGNFIAGALTKSMYCVSDLAYVLSYLNSIRQNIKYEDAYDDDGGSDVPKRLATLVDELSQVLQDYLAEEVSDLTEDEQETVQLTAKVDELAKQVTSLREQVNPTEDNVNPEDVKKMTDGLAALHDTMKKVADGQQALATAQQTLAGDLDKIRESQEGTDKVVAELAKVVKTIASQPMTKLAPTLAAVPKTADVGSQPAPAATSSTPAVTVGKGATPADEAAGRKASHDKLLDIHKNGGFIVGPGDGRFSAGAR